MSLPHILYFGPKNFPLFSPRDLTWSHFSVFFWNHFSCVRTNTILSSSQIEQINFNLQIIWAFKKVSQILKQLKNNVMKNSTYFLNGWGWAKHPFFDMRGLFSMCVKNTKNHNFRYRFKITFYYILIFWINC